MEEQAMSEATTSDTSTYSSEDVEETPGAGAIAEAKEGALESRAISQTNVSSIFWAFSNRTGRGTPTANIPVAAPIVVNPFSQVSVSICERDSNGNPFIGDAHMSILNVAPRNGSVDVRYRVDWPNSLSLRLNLVIVN
jgi:hypothetical protein